jgi:TRAP-type uncharacterized transport system substrate-binding protein
VARRVASATTDLAALREFPAGVALDELCAGRVDTTIPTMGHPNDTVDLALRSCGAVLVPVEGPQVDAIFGACAVIATLVTRADAAADRRWTTPGPESASPSIPWQASRLALA